MVLNIHHTCSCQVGHRSLDDVMRRRAAQAVSLILCVCLYVQCLAMTSRLFLATTLEATSTKDDDQTTPAPVVHTPRPPHVVPDPVVVTLTPRPPTVAPPLTPRPPTVDPPLSPCPPTVAPHLSLVEPTPVVRPTSAKRPRAAPSSSVVNAFHDITPPPPPVIQHRPPPPPPPIAHATVG